MTLEQRVSRLEQELAERERKAADRRMWVYWYSRNALIVIGVTLAVYLALSLA